MVSYTSTPSWTLLMLIVWLDSGVLVRFASNSRRMGKTYSWHDHWDSITSSGMNKNVFLHLTMVSGHLEWTAKGRLRCTTSIDWRHWTWLYQGSGTEESPISRKTESIVKSWCLGIWRDARLMIQNTRFLKLLYEGQNASRNSTTICGRMAPPSGVLLLGKRGDDTWDWETERRVDGFAWKWKD